MCFDNAFFFISSDNISYQNILFQASSGVTVNKFKNHKNCISGGGHPLFILFIHAMYTCTLQFCGFHHILSRTNYIKITSYLFNPTHDKKTQMQF